MEIERLHSRADFTALSAAGRIRTLLHNIRVPPVIPAYLKRLPEFVQGDAFDGPGVITRIRNALVHSGEDKRTGPKLEGEHLMECGALALNYLELAILAACGYQGHYARRGWREGWKGDDEILVPWSSSAP